MAMSASVANTNKSLFSICGFSFESGLDDFSRNEYGNHPHNNKKNIHQINVNKFDRRRNHINKMDRTAEPFSVFH